MGDCPHRVDLEQLRSQRAANRARCTDLRSAVRAAYPALPLLEYVAIQRELRRLKHEDRELGGQIFAVKQQCSEVCQPLAASAAKSTPAPSRPEAVVHTINNLMVVVVAEEFIGVGVDSPDDKLLVEVCQSTATRGDLFESEFVARKEAGLRTIRKRRGQLRQDRIASGLCPNDGTNPSDGNVLCNPCLQKLGLLPKDTH